MRKLRWLIYAPVAVLGFFAPAVSADSTVNTWICWESQEVNWQMDQPLADYQAGLYPSWTDCVAWRNGDPGAEYVWSYGPSVATTSTSTTVLVSTSSEQTTTTESTTTTTVAETTTTVQQTTTTEAPPPPPPPVETTVETTVPETTTIPPTTVVVTTTLGVTTTSQNSTTVPTSTEAPPVSTVDVIPPGDVVIVPEGVVEPTEEETLELSSSEVEQIDVFSGEYDDYVVEGSTITVGERRVVIAVTTVLFVLPTAGGTTRRKVR